MCFRGLTWSRPPEAPDMKVGTHHRRNVTQCRLPKCLWESVSDSVGRAPSLPTALCSKLDTPLVSHAHLHAANIFDLKYSVSRFPLGWLKYSPNQLCLKTSSGFLQTKRSNCESEKQFITICILYSIEIQLPVLVLLDVSFKSKP